MRQAGFYFYFLFPKKTDEATILFFILSKPNEAPFFVHFKHKNVDILILTSEGTFFLFKSEKETDGGHLKQMREGLRNNYCIFFA